MDERQLIARVVAGEPKAERELYDAHVDRVYRLTYRLTGDPTASEELVQETFIKVFSNLARFEGRSALSTWIHSIALSVIRTALRKTVRLRGRETELTDVAAARVEGPGAGASLRYQLHTAIDGLPEEMRIVFVMHDIEGFKHTEIAEVLDVPVGTTKSRLSRAREALRAVLEPPRSRFGGEEGA